jgi:uncharacterized RDD family membrane protein YckC
MEFLPIVLDGNRVYAGFWKRFSAGWIDAFIILPLVFLFTWIEGFDKTLAIFIAIPSAVLFAMFNVFFNARFGGTPGKLAVGIRITKPDGSKIGWADAWKRSSVDLAFAFIILIVEVLALMNVDSGQYVALGWFERTQLLQKSYPSWYNTSIIYLQQVWIWSEVVVLLFNKRKRAIHDFIAGTVVINKKFVEQSNPADQESLRDSVS